MAKNVFRITIIGAGHVGLVTGVVFADYGNYVLCVDNDEEKIENLKKGILPFYEPELKELLYKNVRAKRLSFTSSIKEGVLNSKVIFICVGTPPKKDGSANLYFVEKVSSEMAKYINNYKVIVEKSTVPVETGEWVEKTIKNKCKDLKFDVVSNPEFLREGSAVFDAKYPERIVIGTNSKRAENIMKELYKLFRAPIILCDVKTAELIKHASNAFLATKISYINAIANLCEKIGADVVKVADGMGYDKRINRAFLNAGIGYGGPCLPKDVSAFISLANKVGYDFELLKEVEKINIQQRLNFVEKIKSSLWIVMGKTIGVLGLSFKPDTDDMRDAPSIDIINNLKKDGAKIKVYDPVAIEKAKDILQDVEFCKSPYEVAKDSDCLVIVTEWTEFKRLNLGKIKNLLKQPLIIDGRNIFSPDKLRRLGFKYIDIGRDFKS